MTKWVEKKLDLDFTYISLMTRILFFFSLFLFSLFPLLPSHTDRWKLSNRLLPCAASSNDLSVRFRVNVTVHSNRQSSLHPPPSGPSFVNAQSPPQQENYRARRIDSSFSRLATEWSLLTAINLMLRVATVTTWNNLFFEIFKFNKNLHTTLT